MDIKKPIKSEVEILTNHLNLIRKTLFRLTSACLFAMNNEDYGTCKLILKDMEMVLLKYQPTLRYSDIIEDRDENHCD